MAELHECKDMRPNPGLIDLLEELLEDAKSGKLRSMVAACSEADSQTYNVYNYDPRTRPNPLLAELTIAEHDLVDRIGLLRRDSVLAQQIEDNL